MNGLPAPGDATHPGRGWRRAAAPLAVLVLAGALALTFLAWRAARSGEDRARRAEFELQVQDADARVLQRMRAHEQVLRGAQGLFAASLHVDREEFHRYVESLQLAEAYPGIQGVGFSLLVPAAAREAHVEAVRAEGFPAYAVWPEGVRDPYSSIVFLEPFAGRNLRAFGYDMFSEPVRRAAMERARDTGRAALSGRVRLVQETEENVQAGVLLYLPVYRNGAPDETVEQRRDALIGWVYSPYRMVDLMRGILGDPSIGIHIELHDGPAATLDTLLFDSSEAERGAEPEKAALRAERALEFAGRQWTMVVRPLPDGGPRSASARSSLVAVAGGSASAALALLVWLLGAGRARALEAARRAGRDLAERQRATEEIEAARRFAQATLDAMPDQICVLDEQGRILSVNRAWREFGAANGAPPGGIVEGTPYLATCDGASGSGAEEAARFASRLRDLLEGRAGAFSLEYPCHSPTARRWFVVRASRFADRGLARVVVAHHDVTERRRSEEALLTATRLASVGTLAAGVAHEINNPLSWMQGGLRHGLEILSAPGGPGDPPLDREEIRRVLTETLEGSRRIAGVVKAMRSLGRPDRTEDVLPVDVRAELLDAIQMTRNQLQQTARLTVDLPEGLPPVRARTSELGRVFLNLLLNAAQAIGAGRPDQNSVEVAARQQGDEVVVEVRDTGAGIPSTARERIFDPFFTTKPVGQGTGLGLSIARSIVDAVGGRIEVESQEGRGAVFRVHLPAAAGAVAPQASPAAGPPAARPRRRVLLVDDEPMVLRALQRGLQGVHDVTVLGSAEEALRRLDAGERWDAMLFDLMMPTMDGVSVHGALSDRDPALLPRLAFLTGGAFGERASTFLASHDVTVLAKPVEPERLLEVIEELAAAGAA
ncbi:MAG TPA: CHASE domain-containing protein [Anaeromyxobacteraceae bacterium]|nr:CHASE domain-containing protein [Anaeromyxobacteraceae bacterium]